MVKIKQWWSKLLFYVHQIDSTLVFRFSLHREYDRINDACFGGLLKRPKLSWQLVDSEIIGRRDGMMEESQIMGTYSSIGNYIWINSLHRHRVEAMHTLLHEMSHQFVREVLGKPKTATSDDHGGLFKATFKRAEIHWRRM